MADHIIFYQCSYCKIYGDTIDKVKAHVNFKHKQLHGQSNQAKGIKSVLFPIPVVCLEKYVSLSPSLFEESTQEGLCRKSNRQSRKRFKLEIEENDIPESRQLSPSNYDESLDQTSDEEDADNRKRSKSKSIKKRKKGGITVVKRIAKELRKGVWINKEVDLEYDNKRLKALKTPGAIIVTGKYTCRICRIDFPAPKEYKKHMKETHLTKDNKYDCPRCNKSFFPLQQFSRHMRKYDVKDGLEEIYGWRCNGCKKMFSNRSHFENHRGCSKQKIKGLDYSSKKFQCPLCNSKFVRDPELRRHFLLHLENNPFKCKFTGCDKQFNAWNNLRRHIALHTARKKFDCPKANCSAYYSNIYSLDVHMKKVHSDETNNQSYVAKSRTYKVQGATEASTEKSVVESNVTDVFPKEKQLALTSICESNENDENISIKSECRWEVESIHLEDHITIKEERKLYEESDKDYQDSGSASSDTDQDVGSEQEEDSENNSNFMLRIKLNSIIQSDPVFIKLLKENPAGAEKILPAHLRHKTPKNTKIKLMCPQLKCDWKGETAYDLHVHQLDCHAEFTKPDLKPSTSTSSNPKDDQEKIIHSNKFKCETCCKEFGIMRHLKHHMKIKHDPQLLKTQMKMWKCIKCGSQLKSARTYKAHMLSHTDKLKVNFSKNAKKKKRDLDGDDVKEFVEKSQKTESVEDEEPNEPKPITVINSIKSEQSDNQKQPEPFEILGI